jgi:hypothetical protein
MGAALMPVTVPASSGAQPFTFLATGFTQELYAADLPSFGGVAFAANGDPLEAFQVLYRVDSTQTVTVNGSTIHPTTRLGGTPWIGLANSSAGAVYANTGAGVIRLDPASGATLAGPFGVNGDGFGIVADPQTGNLVYAGVDCMMHFVSLDFSSQGIFSTAPSSCADGIAFDPTGDFLFGSIQGGLEVLDRNNDLVQLVPLAAGACCTDGIAFHGGTPQFVISNNTDGTVTRFDFPNNDYRATPSQSIFASGGFRGDHMGVGPDGCAYLTQGQTRYADGTETAFNHGSLVRICPGFVPPVQPYAFPPGGAFVISGQQSANGSHVTFWGSQWSTENPTRARVASFKGFAASTTLPQCGAAWHADPGSSGSPPAGPLPDQMAVLVTDSYSMTGSSIAGNTTHIVVVAPDPGYAPAAGHPGTGTVIRRVC